MTRSYDFASAMFPNLDPARRTYAYALIDQGLCFHTCPPDCRGACIEQAREAALALEFLPDEDAVIPAPRQADE